MLVRELPPLRHSITVETPAGRHYRWGPDDIAPENVPSGLRWSDTMPGGFESCDLTLPRKPSVDYQDLERLSTAQIHDATGGIVGEYRLERTPRTSGDQFSVSPGLVGWQAALEDDKSARMVYVDRDFSRWFEPNIARRLALATANTPMGAIPVQIGAPEGIVWTPPNEALSNAETTEAWYDAGPGLLVYYFTYRGQRVGSFTSFEAPAVYGGLDADATTGSTAITLDDASHITDLTAGPPRALMVRCTTSAGVTPPAGATQAITEVGVYGNHPLTGIDAGDGHFGYLASDVAFHAVTRWAPMLRATLGYSGSVKPSGFVIPHLTFLDPTTAAEIVRQASRFELPHWGVWENRTFHFDASREPRKSWRARVAPAQLEETGPQVDRLWESVIVSYQDVDGSTRTVGPPGSGADAEDLLLKDLDTENPANKLGIVRRDVLSMGVSTQAAATQVGRIFLQESKLLDSSGRATLTGYVTDEHGVRFPFSAPRAGDDITFIDASLPVPRRIVRTDKDYGAKTCSLDLDSPPEALDALLERLSVNLVRLGL